MYHEFRSANILYRSELSESVFGKDATREAKCVIRYSKLQRHLLLPSLAGKRLALAYSLSHHLPLMKFGTISQSNTCNCIAIEISSLYRATYVDRVCEVTRNRHSTGSDNKRQRVRKRREEGEERPSSLRKKRDLPLLRFTLSDFSSSLRFFFFLTFVFPLVFFFLPSFYHF